SRDLLGLLGLLGRLRLLGRRLALEPLAFGLATDAVGLGILDARGVALHPDPERGTKIERLLVGEPELACQLVDPDPLCQLLPQSFPFSDAAKVAFYPRTISQ